MIIIPINVTYLPINGKKISFRDIYRKLMKCVVDISFANFVTNRTINVIRFEGDLIQTSRGKLFWKLINRVAELYGTNCPNLPRGSYGACMVYHVMFTF